MDHLFRLSVVEYWMLMYVLVGTKFFPFFLTMINNSKDLLVRMKSHPKILTLYLNDPVSLALNIGRKLQLSGITSNGASQFILGSDLIIYGTLVPHYSFFSKEEQLSIRYCRHIAKSVHHSKKMVNGPASWDLLMFGNKCFRLPENYTKYLC